MGDRVAGKVAIVTGGASGIGRGCVMRLAEEGAIVVITDVDVSPGQALADELAGLGRRVKFIEHDVTQERWRPGAVDDEPTSKDRRRHRRHQSTAKAARISSTKIAGCSQAAKWPPLSSSFQYWMFE